MIPGPDPNERLADVTVSPHRRAREVWVRDMREWSNKFVAWGERVRQDIIRLEEKTGIGRGDPGSPPPPPPPPEE
jgi:hypothetical protein